MIHELNIERVEPQNVLISGIPYSTYPYWGGMTERVLYMDIIAPKQRMEHSALPVILFLCGGGFCGMDRSLWIPTLTEYANEGFIVASIDYRTYPDGIYPAPLEDITKAITFLKLNDEKYGIDTSKIIVMGQSAGGYLACVAGLTNPDVKAVVDFYGVTDLTRSNFNEQANESLRREFMNNATKEEELAASPISLVTPQAAPCIIFHGDQDQFLPLEASIQLHDRLISAGVSTEMYILRGESHGTDAFYQEQIRKLVISFLRKNMCYL